ncbi:hypothetical protein [Phyllobacterium phragmitis]|uniref:Uncharacterized protein n=1 Tax=Phyllobacterium phragmitis TaxID=2670329 RepID=A0ABQ0H554_9HYPH
MYGKMVAAYGRLALLALMGASGVPHAAFGQTASGTITWENLANTEFKVSRTDNADCVIDPGPQSFTVSPGKTYELEFELNSACDQYGDAWIKWEFSQHKRITLTRQEYLKATVLYQETLGLQPGLPKASEAPTSKAAVLIRVYQTPSSPNKEWFRALCSESWLPCKNKYVDKKGHVAKIVVPNQFAPLTLSGGIYGR